MTNCRPDTHLPCPDRKAAMDRDEFEFQPQLGWVWWRSRDVTDPWDFCPWCGNTLPTPGPVPPAPSWPDNSPYRDEGPE